MTRAAVAPIVFLRERKGKAPGETTEKQSALHSRQNHSRIYSFLKDLIIKDIPPTAATIPQITNTEDRGKPFPSIQR